MIFIEKLDGTRIDLKSLGIIPLQFNVESLSPRHNFEIVEGRNGYIDLGTTVEGRKIKTKFAIKAKDLYDYPLLNNEVFKLFDARTEFYLIHKYEPKKRWRVKTETAFSIERLLYRVGEFDIVFISSSPYAESYGTTLDPFTFTGEMWQVGQGVISEDLKYVHNTNTFSIYNGSDIDLDPREFPLKIKYQGASNNLTIKNHMTGDEWKYNGTSGLYDTILLDGIRSLKNGLTIFGQTNRKLITLKQGWNDFTLTGTSGSFLISFDFRFYTY